MPDEKAPTVANSSFGWFTIRPEFLQRFNTTKWMVAVLCLGTVAATTCAYGVFPAVLTTLESIFGLSNAQMGFVMSFYDIFSLAVTGWAMIYGEKVHKGRCLGIGFAIAAVGCFAITIPHWFHNPRDTGIPAENSTIEFYVPLCLNDSAKNEDDCIEGRASTWSSTPIWFFLLGQGLMSVAGPIINTIGVTYVDENVTQRSSPVYMSIIMNAGVVSSVVGTVAGGLSLSLHDQFYKLSRAEVERSIQNKTFFGAWWLVFAISGILGLFTVIPMMGFPRELPERQKHRAKDKDMTHKGAATMKALNPGDESPVSFKAYLNDVCTLLRNPAFSLLIVRNSLQAIIIVGIVTFMPLYFQFAFGVAPEFAAVISAVIVVVPVIVGAVVGGFLLRIKSFSIRGLFALLIVQVCLTFTCDFAFLSHCATPEVVGVNAAQPVRDHKLINGGHNQTDRFISCQDRCGCPDDDPYPVCNPATGLSYASPCFGGCISRGNGSTFYGCQCATKDDWLNSDEELPTLDAGICPYYHKCGHKRITVFVVLAFSGFIGGTQISPTSQILLRAVPFSLRTIGQAVALGVTKICGFIPGPILFGLVIDACCLFNSYRCGNPEGCILYNNESMSSYLVSATTFIDGCSILLLTSALLLFEPVGRKSWASVARNKLSRKFRRKTRVNPPTFATDGHAQS